MPVPLGFVLGTPVATPTGDRPIEALSPGDVVLGWRDGAIVPARVTQVHADTADVVVAIELAEGRVRGCAPGTSLLDVFEEGFRTAASLSATSELLALDADRVTTRPLVVTDVPERLAPGARLVHLRLDPAAGAFFADGVVVAAKEVG